MKNTLRISLLIALVGVFTAFTPPKTVDSNIVAKGKVFESEEGGFKVFFPSTPEISKDAMETDLGQTELAMFMCESPDGNTVMMVSYNDYKGTDLSDVDAKVLFGGGRDGAMQSLGITTVENEESFTRQGVEGMRFQGQNGEYSVMYNMYLKGNRLYQVAILTNGDYPDTKTAKKFFKSFKFI